MPSICETREDIVGISFSEAISQVTGPGSTFETVDLERDGYNIEVFKNAPPTIPAMFAGGRGVANTFLVYEDEEWSFDRVLTEADALGYALVHHYGIKKGDRVGISMRNLPEWIVAFAAILSVGAISVSFNAWWTEDEHEYAITDSGCKILIADTERVARASAVCDRAGVSIIGVRLDTLQPLSAHVAHWNDVVVRGVPMPAVEISPDDDATILYTSGTTGFPKGAVSTHRAVTNAVMAFASRSALQALFKDLASPPNEGNAPCFILIVPLFHVTGCVPVMLSAFTFQFKLVMMYRWEPERALQLIERHKVTTFIGVPTQSWDLLECPNFSKYDTSSLAAIGGGGAPAPPKLVARVESSFSKGRPSIGYGMTETNAYGPGNTGNDYVSHPLSTGRVPIASMQVEIRDEHGTTLPVNTSGEVWMKSPTLIRGYWNKPEATAETIVKGWLRSGDLGRIDAEGFLYIEDRAKDMILRAGENVYSAEVEAAIYEHASVYEAAVFGVPHERLGEEVAAVILLKEGMQADDEEIRAFVAARIAAFKVPTRIAFTNERLPRNPAGKFLKRDLRTRFFA